MRTSVDGNRGLAVAPLGDARDTQRQGRPAQSAEGRGKERLQTTALPPTRTAGLALPRRRS